MTNRRKRHLSNMTGRPPRKAYRERCDRLEQTRVQSGLSRAAVAQALGTSASNLSRSLSAGGFSPDMAQRVEMLPGRGAVDVRNEGAAVRDVGGETLQRAVLLSLELSKLVPDLERALVAVRRAANAKEAP